MASIDNKNDDQITNILEEQNQKLQVPTKLPVLLLRDIVIFPYMIAPLFVGREKSKNAIDAALSGNRMILLLTQKDMEIEDPKREEVYDVGTVALIMRMLKLPDGRVRILAQGLIRARVESFEEDGPYITAGVTVLAEPDAPEKSLETEALIRNVRSGLEKAASLGKTLPPEVLIIASNVDEAGRLADLTASNLELKVEEAQQILEIDDPTQRLKRVYELLTRELELLDVQSKISTEAKGEMDKLQKQYYLRQDEGHPEGARRGDRDPGGHQGLPGQAPPDPGLRRGQGGAGEADRPSGPNASRIGRDGRRPQLSRLDVLAALEQEHGR